MQITWYSSLKPRCVHEMQLLWVSLSNYSLVQEMERSKLGRLKKFFSRSMWSRKSSPHSNCSSASSGRELELPPGIRYKKLAWNHSKKRQALEHSLIQVLCTVPWYGVQCCHLEELIHLTFSFSLLVSFSSGSGLVNGLSLEQFYFWLLVVLEGLTWLSWNPFSFSNLWISLVLFGACPAFYGSGVYCLVL